jgi:hypothetical protein
MTPDRAREIRDILRQLKRTLEQLTQRDPEQEVTGVALPVLDAVLEQARDLVPDSPVVSRVGDVISPDAVLAGEPLRAADALIVVETLWGALRRPAGVFSIERS